MLNDFVPLVALTAVVVYLINLIREAKGRQWGAVLTMILVWVAGVFVAWLFGESDFATAIPVGDVTLADLKFASLIIVGLVIASAASNFHDVVGAVDNTRSTAKPRLAPELDAPHPPSD